MKLGDIDPRRPGECGNGSGGERTEGQPIGRRCQLAEDQTESLRAAELIRPVAGQHESGCGGDAASEQGEQIERRLVRPVEILEHEYGGTSRSQLTQQAEHDLVWSSAGGEQILQLAAGELGDVEQRCQRTRGPHRLAPAPQDADAAVALLAEQAQQRRFAHPGLARQEQHLADAVQPHRVQRVPEDIEAVFPLEQRLRSLHSAPG